MNFSEIQKLAKFAIVGVATNISGYILYLGITYLGAEPKIAMSLLYALGTYLGFLANRTWTFSHNGRALGGVVRYGLVYVIGYALNFSMLSYFVDQKGYPHALVQAVAIIIVAAFTFLSLRFLVFPAAQNTPRPQ